MKKTIFTLLLLVTLLPAFNAYSKDDPTFREPFTLELKYNDADVAEIPISKAVPYTIEGDIYVFKGENFGVDLKEKKDSFVATYKENGSESDLEITFDHDPNSAMGIGMILTLNNRSEHDLSLQTVFTVLGVPNTFTLPIDSLPAGKVTQQTWEHPLVQLVLREIRKA